MASAMSFASAATISVNFNFDTGRQGKTVAGTAGVEAVGNWTNIGTLPIAQPYTASALLNSAGAATTADISVTSTWLDNNIFWGANLSGTENHNLMSGGFQIRDRIVTVSLTNLTASVGATYDLYVYFSHFGTTESATNTLSGGATGSNTIISSTFSGTFTDGTNGTGHYARFTGLTADAFTLTTARTSGPGNSLFTSVAGIQLVAVPEPSSSALLLGGIGFILLRRRRA